jgi:tripartite-type tricarboxylate transporter receptor subunit TctC
MKAFARRLTAMLGLALAIGTTAAPTTVSAQSAASYPTKPIRLVVPYLAGGVTDVMARQFAQVLGEKLQQSVIVDNRPGANTLIATQIVASAPADGYTLFFTDLSLLSYNSSLYKQQTYDLARDFVPVASVADIPLGLAVNGFVPANNVQEFIAYAKANPGKLNYATTASGGLPHLGMENFKALTGTEMTQVPYKGAAAAITDMIGGQVQVMFNDISTSVQYTKTGKMKVLAISGDKRMAKIPDVPTFAELGYKNLNVAALMGFVAPAKTPPAILEKLNLAIRDAVNNPQVVAYMNTNDLVIHPTSGAELSAIMTSQGTKWRELVKRLNITVD